MSSFDWETTSALATGVGTLVLAGATFASVRSANRTARITERTLQAELRPLLLPSRARDVEEKVGALGIPQAQVAKHAHGIGVAAARRNHDFDPGRFSLKQGLEVARAYLSIGAEQCAIHVDGDQAGNMHAP